MAQTTYTREFAPAFAGMLGDSGPTRIEAFQNGASADLAVGIFVKHSAEGVATNLSASTDKIAGVALHSAVHNPGDGSKSLTTGKYIENGAAFNVLCEGAVWCVCEEAMAVGDAVYTRHTANGGNTLIGAVRNDIDTDKCILVKGARVLRASQVSDTLVLIQFDINAALT